MLFSIRFGSMNVEGEAEASSAESILNISYRISGDRTVGAHTPIKIESSATESVEHDLIFKTALILQRPVLDPCLAVGFLPFPSDGLGAGQLVAVNWRIERLKDADMVSQSNEEVLYAVDANSENWMIAGRKRGHVSLSTKQGSRIVISILCIPLVAGYVRPLISVCQTLTKQL